MARRSKDWNEGLARDLKQVKFAQEFILAALEEEIPLQVVLEKVIRAYGIKEFAQKIKIAPSNLSRAINPKYNLTQDTLNKLLKPFKLKLSVVPIGQKMAA